MGVIAMQSSPLGSVYDQWTQPSYEVRVRGTAVPTFLWGSAGVLNDITFDKPLLLHIRNDLFGSPIQYGTVVSGVQTKLGTLGPGECVAITLQNMSGVFAICEAHSTVGCLIKERA
jgi:hypothetical protein